MRLRTSTRLMLRRIRRFVVYRILHVDDTPHRIALGVAVGVFVAWTPTHGLQMILIVAIAALLRANKLVGVPMAWLSDPVKVPVTLLCYWLGCRMLRMRGNGAKIVQAMREAWTGEHGFFGRVVCFFHAMQDAFLPWLVGSIVIGLVTGAAAYLLTYRAVVGVRRRRARRLGRSAVQKEQAACPPSANTLAAQAVTETPAPSQSGGNA